MEREKRGGGEEGGREMKERLRNEVIQEIKKGKNKTNTKRLNRSNQTLSNANTKRSNTNDALPAGWQKARVQCELESLHSWRFVVQLCIQLGVAVPAIRECHT